MKIAAFIIALWRRRSFSNDGDVVPVISTVGMIGLENESAVAADNWVMIAPYGDHKYEFADGKQGVQRFDREAAESMVAWFNSLAGRLTRLFKGVPLFNGHPDHDDRAVAGTYPDKRIHGAFVSLDARDNALFGQLVPELSGKALVNTRTKVKLSPRWFSATKPVAVENGMPIYRPIVLASVGLTNRPNINNAPELPMLNEERHKKGEGMKDLLITILGLLGFSNEAPAGDAEPSTDLITKIKTALGTMADKAMKHDTLVTELANEKQGRIDDVKKLTTDCETVKKEFANERAARVADLVGSAVAAGRITAADKSDWERRLKLDFANESIVLDKVEQKVKTQPTVKQGRRTEDEVGNGIVAIQGFINEELAKLPKDTKNRYDAAFAAAKKSHPEAFVETKADE